ncbi:LysE family translocator [Pseudomonas putida]|jgi:threonine/homoserine/homoserine lactone efflux protein|uniref:LysE family translocator n=1 Tax=Pseudomonas putida TaxID=303 RepID=UPI0023645E0E|nr:LysE family translocator [Pseudomonas putida]MDD2055430.1 LysE family translocator [Pseudomonas putida]
MQLSLLLLYALSVLLLIATPGPVMALVVEARLRGGTRQALLTALGSNGASLVLIGVAVLVLGASLSLDPRLLEWISLGGCLFIGYLGLTGLRRGAYNEGQESPSGHGWGRGFLVGIANPKDIVFFIAFFPQFIPITTSFSQSVTWLGLIWLVIDLVILGGYIYLAGRPFSLRHAGRIATAASVALLLIGGLGALYAGARLLGGE